MIRFDIITEADARGLEIGSAVTLSPGGHVTPLAQDTLTSRRITVVRDQVDGDGAMLIPVADIRRVALGSDHTGVALKTAIRDRLRSRGIQVEDIGTNSSEPVDYPDIAGRVARMVARREADAGIVIDGAGLGSTIAANKVNGVRAAMCSDRTLARYAREHNGANVLALGATLISVDDALAIVETWLATPMREARYIRRLAKIRHLEQTG
ncbi:MAG TPA: ribose 5-phosphate isomerase B [Vicinamibacterales bacterium]|nr:ribose 5-phosphate isomerase B [Vicinamibacterales bacterium]